MELLSFLKKFFFHSIGIDIRKYPDWVLKSRIDLLNSNHITTVIDIGANTGQYGEQIKSLGFKGRIISFEPQKKEFDILLKRTQKYTNWEAINLALGDYNGKSIINIASNSFSSSILDIGDENENLFTYINKQNIEVVKLDTIFDDFITPQENVFLKIDVQGFEKKVLDGSINSLKKIKGIQLEVSHFENYKGELLFYEILNTMTVLGFKLFAISPELFNRNDGRQLQSDCVFYKNF